MGKKKPFTSTDFHAPKGRARARRHLMLVDHGLLRLCYDNSHEIDKGRLWRSYQPSPEKLADWKKRGIKTIINLRGATESGHYWLEKAACEELGLELVDFRFYSREAPSPQIIHGAKKLFEQITYPALLHCKSGADRAGIASTLYMFFQKGRPLEEAMEQLSFRYGHVRQGKTGVIDYALEKYLHHAKQCNIDTADPDAFLAWVDHDYDYKAVKQEYLGTWWGNLLTDKILRRE